MRHALAFLLLCWMCSTTSATSSSCIVGMQDGEQAETVDPHDETVTRGWDAFQKRCREKATSHQATLERRLSPLIKRLAKMRSEYEDTVEDLSDAGVSDLICSDLLQDEDLALATIKLHSKSAQDSTERKHWRSAKAEVNRIKNTAQEIAVLEERLVRIQSRLNGPTWPAFQSKEPGAFELSAVDVEGQVVGTHDRGCLVEVKALVDPLDGRPVQVQKLLMLVASGLDTCREGQVIFKRGTVAVTRGPVILRIRGKDQPIPLVHLAFFPDVLKRVDRVDVAESLQKALPRFNGLR